MILSLIGPGDVEYHYQKLLGISKEKFEKELEEISKIIANSQTEILLLPDRGISLEIAKLYRKNNGKKIIGVVPKFDTTFGIKHLEPYMNLEINQKPLFDEIIDTENWYKHDLIKGLLGNAILYLGSSPGTNGELNYAIYLFKFLQGKKDGLKIKGKSIHPEIKADENFTIYVYTPFLKNKKLVFELEEYIKRFNINLVYINKAKDLERELKKF